MWRVTRLGMAALASVLTVVPQHEVWGGQSLLRELSRLTAEVRCIEQLRHVILQPLPLNHHLLSDSNGPPEQDPYAVSGQSSSPTYRKWHLGMALQSNRVLCTSSSCLLLPLPSSLYSPWWQPAVHSHPLGVTVDSVLELQQFLLCKPRFPQTIKSRPQLSNIHILSSWCHSSSPHWLPQCWSPSSWPHWWTRGSRETPCHTCRTYHQPRQRTWTYSWWGTG